MNKDTRTDTTAKTDSFKMLKAMVGIGIICALLIVSTFEVTFAKREQNKAEALEKAIFKVLPGIVSKKAFQLDQNNSFIAVENEDNPSQLIYAGYDINNQLVGVAVEASGQGYADILRILYGYDPNNQKIIGFYVLESKETPGLGDKIEKDPDFLANFSGLDVSLNKEYSDIINAVITVKNDTKENPWEVDGITGATISSRAIGNIIASSTEQWVPLIYNEKESFIKEKQ